MLPNFVRREEVRSSGALSKASAVLPNFVTSTDLSDDSENSSSDPWLPEKLDGPSDIRVIGLTPIGTLPILPTSDVRPATPKRRQKNPVTLEIVGGCEESFLNATVYFDHTKPGDEKYDLGQKMKQISSTVQQLHSTLRTEYRQVPAVHGFVTVAQFEDALAAYENNQVYFQERIEKRDMLEVEIRKGLFELEQWFICIIEPKPRSSEELAEWWGKEAEKVTKRRSAYCDPTLDKYIDPVPDAVLAFVRQHHLRL